MAGRACGLLEAAPKYEARSPPSQIIRFAGWGSLPIENLTDLKIISIIKKF
jgi:hypothetical protein